jgi:O-antigen/teichoic acid export membrane protein
MKRLIAFLFGEYSLRQTMAKNSFWLTVSNVGSQIVKLAIVIYAARLLGAEEYGFFSYAIGIAATFTIFSDVGLNYLLTIKMAQREDRAGYLSTLLFLRVSLVFAVILATLAAGPLLARFREVVMLIPFVALLIAFDDLRALMSGIARAENRMDKEAFGHITSSVLILLLALLSLRYAPTSYMLTILYLIGSALGALLMFFTVQGGIRAIFRPLRIHLKLVKPILMAALPFGLAGAMWSLMINTDILLIGWFRTAAELGYYAAAQRPVMALSIVSTVMVGGSLTLIVRLVKERAKERLRGFVERLVAFSFAIVLPLAAGGAIVAPQIVQFLYGTEYAPATLAFQLLLLTLVVAYPSSIVANLVLAHEGQRIYTLAMIAGALGNALLDLLLIPRFGIVGSVIATIGALSIIYGYLWQQAKKLQPFAVLPLLPRIAAATVLMSLTTLVLDLLSVPLLATIFISGAAYFGALVLMQEPLLKELRGLFRLPQSTT